MKVILIAAMDKNRVIGEEGKLPWNLPADMKHFQDSTRGYPVIMGRKTYESIPEPSRPLKGRKNIIITKQDGFQATGCFITHSLEDALEIAARENPDRAYIIGGAQVYKEAMPIADELDLTFIDGEFKGSAVFPEIRKGEWDEVRREPHSSDSINLYSYCFVYYQRVL